MVWSNGVVQRGGGGRMGWSNAPHPWRFPCWHATVLPHPRGPDQPTMTVPPSPGRNFKECVAHNETCTNKGIAMHEMTMKNHVAVCAQGYWGIGSVHHFFWQVFVTLKS